MNNKKIDSNQFCIFIILSMTSIFLGLIDNILLNVSKNDAILSVIIGSILGLIFIYIFIKIFNYHPEKNIFDKNKLLFKKTYKIINFMIFCFAFIMLTIGLRSLLIFIKSRYLFDTPYYVLGIFMVTTIIIIVKNGIESFSRLFQIYGILSAIIIIIIELALSRYVELNNFLPLFTNSVSNILYGALFYAFGTSFIIFLFLSIKKDVISDNEKLVKKILFYYLINSIFLISVMFFMLSCFGYQFVSIFRYPEYMALKKIAIGSTEQHIENLFAFHWNLYMLALCSISFYTICKYIKSISKSTKKQSTISYIIIFLSMIVSKNIFGEIMQSILLMKKLYIFYICIPFLIIYILIFIKCNIHKKAS